jgi:hypothetical protein
MIEAVPVPGQFLPIQEDHEVRQIRVAIDSAGTYGAHEVHAERIAPQSEERAVPQAQNAHITPYEIEAQRQNGIADVLA